MPDKKHHGHMMMAAGNGSGSGSSSSGRKKHPSGLSHPRSPSGTAYPAVGTPLAPQRPDTTGPIQLQKAEDAVATQKAEDAVATIVPVPVALTWSTILKLLIPATTLALAAAVTVAYLIYDMKAHQASTRVHVNPKTGVSWGIMQNYETRREAQTQRKAMTTNITKSLKREMQLRSLEAEVKQKQVINEAVEQATKRQDRKLDRILKAVR